MRPVISLAAAALLVGSTAACSDAAPAPEPAPTTSSEEAASTGPEGASGTIELPSNAQTSSRHGTTVAVTSVTVDEADDIYLDVEALVAGRRNVRLALTETVLLDDLGHRYEWAPPEENAGLMFAQDSSVELTLAFVGPIDPEATRVTLGLNAAYDGTLRSVEEGESSNAPSFTFADLPLPGVGLDDEAADADDPRGIPPQFHSVEVDGAVHEGPVGMRVEVTGIETTASGVLVSLEVANVSDDWRRLLTRPPLLRALRGGQVIEDAAFRFQSLTDDEGEHDDLRLEPGEEASVVLAFRGTIPADADGLRLGITAFPDEMLVGQLESEERNGRGPRVIFDTLPVPGGVTGADEPTSDESTDDGES